MLASSVFLIAIRVARGRRAGALSSVFYTPNQLTTRDRWDLLWLGLVGWWQVLSSGAASPGGRAGASCRVSISA